MASLFLVCTILSALLAHLTLPSATADSNVLLTGQTLYTDQQLSYADSTLIMQGDCNLVLYGPRGFQSSNTHGRGTNCTLSFTDNGRLIIRRAGGSTVWTTPNSRSEKGRYAAVLLPDGTLGIFGPAVWSAPALGHADHEQARGLRNVPMVSNLLLSGQILYGDGKLTSRDYSLVMKDDCDLALEKAGHGAVWQTQTAGNGVHCFLRLDHQGRITVVDDEYRSVWTSKPASKNGQYVLLIQASGQAVIYGPKVWSSAPGAGGEITQVVTMEME